MYCSYMFIIHLLYIHNNKKYYKMKKIENIGFGTYRLKGCDAEKSVIWALNNGYKHIDTAPLYANLVEVGNGIQKSGIDPTNITITSKISRDSLISGKIEESFRSTLRDLQVNYIDELILHEPINPVENWKLLVNLYQNSGRGLIGRIGVSNFDVDTINDIINATNFVPCVNQIEINPFLTRGNLSKQLAEMNIDITAHTPLAKGEMFGNSVLQNIAKEVNLTPAQVMLKWGMQMGYRVIPRSSNEKHIIENIDIFNNPFDNQTIDLISNLHCGYATHPKYLKKTEYSKRK